MQEHPCERWTELWGEHLSGHWKSIRMQIERLNLQGYRPTKQKGWRIYWLFFFELGLRKREIVAKQGLKSWNLECSMYATTSASSGQWRLKPWMCFRMISFKLLVGMVWPAISISDIYIETFAGFRSKITTWKPGKASNAHQLHLQHNSFLGEWGYDDSLKSSSNRICEPVSV